MPIRETASERGARRGRMLLSRAADGLAIARRSSGLSLREVGRRVGVGHDRVARAERGDPTALTIDLAARMAAVLGQELNVSLHPEGEPVRDKAHLALLERFRSRLGQGVRWRTEVPMPIEGDRRSADAVIEGDGVEAIVEAETHLADIQALERGIAGKQRDLGVGRVILLVSPPATTGQCSCECRSFDDGSRSGRGHAWRTSPEAGIRVATRSWSSDEVDPSRLVDVWTIRRTSPRSGVDRSMNGPIGGQCAQIGSCRPSSFVGWSMHGPCAG